MQRPSTTRAAGWTRIVRILCIALIAILAFPCAAAGTPEPERAQIMTTWPTRDRLVALTFDAGSDEGIAAEILDILAEYDATATFFLTGAWMQMSPSAAGRIVEEGHALGNHSYSHPDFTEISVEKMREEIRRTDDLAQELLGTTLQPHFRPPYGAYNAQVLEVLASEGYRYSVMWTVDSLDWRGISAEEIVERVKNHLRPGAVILMHVGSGTHTAEAFPQMLDHLLSEGYTPVTLDQLIASTEGSVVYTAVSGDTLYSIAARFGITVEEIIDHNELDRPELVVGQMLLIPVEPVEKPREEPEEPQEEEPGEEEEQQEQDPEVDPPAAGEGGAGEEEIPPPADAEANFWSVLGRIITAIWTGLRNLVSRLLFR
ncbi:MAG: polysaccharide deacetylase family protein [Bacillota bacterium]